LPLGTFAKYIEQFMKDEDTFVKFYFMHQVRFCTLRYLTLNAVTPPLTRVQTEVEQYVVLMVDVSFPEASPTAPSQETEKVRFGATLGMMHSDSLHLNSSANC
jgi:hypothetical protein